MTDPFDSGISKIGQTSAAALMKMEPGAAKDWLLETFPDLDANEVLALIDELCPQSGTIEHPLPHRYPTVPIVVPRNRFYASAWLCGASWGQLALMFNVTRATVASSTKMLLKADANVERYRVGVSLEQLSLLWMVYQQLVTQNGPWVLNSRPSVVARTLNSRLVEE